MNSVEAVVVTGAAFRRFLLTSPDVTFRLLRRVLARARESDQVRTDLLAYSVDERLARLLVELTGTFGEPEADGAIRLPLSLSQSELASAVSASRETIVRALRKLREVDCVRTSRKQLVIVRPAVLRAMTDQGDRES